jgi:hypothetical protein
MDNNSRALLGDKTNTSKEGNIASYQRLHGMYVRGKGIKLDGKLTVISIYVTVELYCQIMD